MVLNVYILSYNDSKYYFTLLFYFYRFSLIILKVKCRSVKCNICQDVLLQNIGL